MRSIFTMTLLAALLAACSTDPTGAAPGGTTLDVGDGEGLDLEFFDVGQGDGEDDDVSPTDASDDGDAEPDHDLDDGGDEDGAGDDVADQDAPVDDTGEGDAPDDGGSDAPLDVADAPDHSADVGDEPDSPADVGDEPDSATDVGDEPDSPADVGDEPDSATDVGDELDSATDVGDEPDSPADVGDEPDSPADVGDEPDIAIDIPDIAIDLPDIAIDIPIDLPDISIDLDFDLGDGPTLETCEDADFLTINEIEDGIDGYIGETVWVEGLLRSHTTMCTLLACTELDPCCNTCSSGLGLSTLSGLHPLSGDGVGCVGDDCDPYGTCKPGEPLQLIGMQVKVIGPTNPGATTFELELVEACAFPTSGVDDTAQLLWQAPGGFAGTGPALIMSGAGRLELWFSTEGVNPGDRPAGAPDLVLDLHPDAAGNLIQRALSAPLLGLPHEGAGGECYGMVSLQACSFCGWFSIPYTGAAQVEPELEAVWRWFDLVLSDQPAYVNPRNYCRFE